MSKIDHSLFPGQSDAVENAYGTCPECDELLAIKHGKSGPFLGCSSYPKCDFSKPLNDTENALIKVMEGSSCPLCSSDLAIKKGRYGLFIGCTTFPECHHMAPLKQQEESSVACPSCSKGKLKKRTNKFGKSFYACDHYPKCKYALNQPPVSHACEKCEWPIVQEKHTANGIVWQCPQKTCGHKQVPPIEQHS